MPAALNPASGAENRGVTAALRLMRAQRLSCGAGLQCAARRRVTPAGKGVQCFVEWPCARVGAMPIACCRTDPDT